MLSTIFQIQMICFKHPSVVGNNKLVAAAKLTDDWRAEMWLYQRDEITHWIHCRLQFLIHIKTYSECYFLN